MAETKAERLVAEEMNRLGGEETDLLARRKGYPRKLAITARTSCRCNFDTDVQPGLRLTWNVGVLESADEVTGLYTTVTNAVSPTLASLTEAKKLYRTKIQ